MNHRTILSVVPAGLFVFVSFASAQDFHGIGVTADSAARAGIYAASANNPSDALAVNPAGLTALTGPTANFSLNGTFARGTFSNASNVNSPMAGNYGFVPFGAFGTPLGEHWAIAIGVIPDLLSASKWNYADTPGFAGTTYGPQSEKSQIIAIRYAAAVAYRFSKKFSLGAGVGLDYNSNILKAPYIFQQHPALAGLKTLLDLHTTGYGWNSTFGFTAKPSKRFEVGFSCQLPTPITSHGVATGNLGAEFQALGLAAQPDFAYRAQVHIKLPPSAVLSTAWQATRTTRLSFQTDWIGWRGSFDSLPVTLTQGTNNDINSLLQSSTIKDAVPLNWKDQITFRGAIEHTYGDGFTVGLGYLHGNNPVPSSTLSPLTAAIMQNGLTTGAGWRMGRLHFSAAYGYDFTAREQVGTSALLYNEYSNSTTRIGTQAFTLSTSFTL